MECITNLVEFEMTRRTQEEKLFRSKHQSTREQHSAVKSSIPRTLGCVQTPLKSPQDYLKKHSRDMKTDLNAKSVACLCRKKYGKDSPLIPKSYEVAPVWVPSGQRNFAAENNLEVLKPAPTPKRVNNGRALDGSGWLPKYSHTQDYGKVPLYIEKIKKNVRLPKEEFLISRQLRKEDHQILSVETKQKILERLVRNLKELLRRYLTLPVKIETPSQIKRKKDRIVALQNDIDLIQRNKEILLGKGKIYIKK